MKKIISWILVVVILISGAGWFILQRQNYFSPSLYADGDMLFTYNTADINTISILSDNQKVKLRKIDGSWKLRRYYIDNTPIDDFIKKLARATVISEVTKTPKQKISSTIMLYQNEQMLLNFSVFPAEDENQSIISAGGKFFLADQNLSVKTQDTQYYQEPLISLEEHKIEKSGGFEGDLNNIRYLDARQELPQGDYEYESFIAVTEDGIKIIGGIYKYPNSKWMTLQLKTTIMPTIIAEDFVKENNFRYDGWYFLLDEVRK